MCHVLCILFYIILKLYSVIMYSFLCVSFLQRETIVKLVSIERGASFCYVVVSKGGRVGIYSGLLKLMCSYEVYRYIYIPGHQHLLEATYLLSDHYSIGR